MDRFIKIITWVSPILKLVASTSKAITDGYDETFIKDPGHIFIRKLDIFLSIIAVVAVLAIVIPSGIYYSDFYTNEHLVAFLILFFPYFLNIYVAVCIYVVSILLSFYDKKRKHIIKKINKSNGVW